MGGKTGARSNSRVVLEGRGDRDISLPHQHESHMTDYCRILQLS